MSGPCLSSSVPGRPLRPGTRRSLGEPLPHQQADRPRAHPEAAAFATFDVPMMPWKITRGINPSFPGLSPSSGQVAHVILTRAPLNRPNIATQSVPFDLHVLSTPPAFVLSQNQTLRKKNVFPLIPTGLCRPAGGKIKTVFENFPNHYPVGRIRHGNCLFHSLDRAPLLSVSRTGRTQRTN